MKTHWLGHLFKAVLVLSTMSPMWVWAEANVQTVGLPQTVDWKGVALHEDKIILMGEQDSTFTLVHFDPEAGEARWTRRIDEELSRFPWHFVTRPAIVVYGGLAISGYDPDTGEELWRMTHKDPAAFLMAIREDDFFFFTETDHILQISARDGSILATHKLSENAGLAQVYDGWVVGNHALLKGRTTSGAAGAVSVSLKDESFTKLYTRQGDLDSTLSMILLAGARDPVVHGRRSAVAVTVLADDDHVRFEAWDLKGERAWEWRIETAPEAFIEQASSSDEYLRFDYDRSLLVSTQDFLTAAGAHALRIEGFDLTDRSKLWSQEMAVPSPGRIAAVRELGSGLALVLLRSHDIFDTWFMNVLIEGASGKILWHTPDPMPYPDHAFATSERLVQIIAPYGPNSRKKGTQNQVQQLQIIEWETKK